MLVVFINRFVIFMVHLLGIHRRVGRYMQDRKEQNKIDSKVEIKVDIKLESKL